MKHRSYTPWVILLILLSAAGLVFLQYRFYVRSVRDMVATPIPLEQRIISGGPGEDQIPAIDTPVFESVASANVYLDDAGLGIVVAQDGYTRFYPFQILVWHEAVNDLFAETPLLISYSPLTFTVGVFERSVSSEILNFGVSGMLYDNHTLLVDRTHHALWMQPDAQRLSGEGIAEALTPVPYFVTSWDVFKRLYPDSMVLSRETGFDRDYTHDPYGSYHENNTILYTLTHHDDRYHPKTVTYGFAEAEKRYVSMQPEVKEKEVINTQAGMRPVVVWYDTTLGIVRAFERTQNTRTFTFEQREGAFIDKESQSRWNLNGKAVSGPEKGTQLQEIPLQVGYWFSWFNRYPDLTILTPSS